MCQGMISVLEKHREANKSDRGPTDYRGRERITQILLLILANIY